MATNRPAASVTGRHGWNWNQRHTETDSDAETTRSGDVSTTRSHETSTTQSKTAKATRSRADSRTASTADSRESDSKRRSTDSKPSYEDLQRRVVQLETELEQKDCQLQYVIDHYERLLTEKNQQLRGQTSPKRRNADSLVDRLRNVTDR